MSNKPRRDITLGEMQDECKKRNAYCGDMGICPYRDFCHETVGDKCGWGDKGPREWKLSEPPRFNEAQMAFWRGLHAIGINFVMLADDGLLLRMAESRQADNCTMIAVLIEIKLGLSKGEELDLAELFGKDGADEKT